MQWLSESVMLFITVFGSSILIDFLDAKKVLVKIHVPELVKHQHHTNVVFVHKHHHHPKHKPVKPHHHHHHHHHKSVKPKPKKNNHQGYSFSDHYTYGDPYLGQKYSHYYDHHHHHHQYSINNDHQDFNNDFGKKKFQQQLNLPRQQNILQNKKLNKPPKQKYNFPKSQHINHTPFVPSINPFNENNVRETNHTFKHESVEIAHNDGIPEVKHFHDYSVSVKDGYDVEEPSSEHKDKQNFKFTSPYEEDENKVSQDLKYANPYAYEDKENLENHSADYNIPEGLSKYTTDFNDYETEHENFKILKYVNDGDTSGSKDKKKNSEDYFKDYAEDYTNPESVAKYTSTIQHGAIGLEDTNYGPNHGNDLEEYIRGYRNAIRGTSLK